MDSKGFMGSHIMVFHVGANGDVTEIKEKDDIRKVLGNDLAEAIRPRSKPVNNTGVENNGN